MSMQRAEGAARKALSDFFNVWSDEERIAHINRKRVLNLRGMESERKYYTKKHPNQIFVSTEPCQPFCILPRSTVGDSCSFCYKCWNLRADFDVWMIWRYAFDCYWSDINIPEKFNGGSLDMDMFAPNYLTPVKEVK
jgi:hypothetical protein